MWKLAILCSITVIAFLLVVTVFDGQSQPEPIQPVPTPAQEPELADETEKYRLPLQRQHWNTKSEVLL